MSIFLSIESTIWRAKIVLVKCAAKAIMLHSYDVENCDVTSATMVEKREIKKEGRTYYRAGAPNDVSYKNNTYISGISIHYFPKRCSCIAKMDAFRSSRSRRFYSSMSSALCSVPASKTPVTDIYH